MGQFATTTSLFTKMIGTVNDTTTTNLASASIYDAENEIKKRLGDKYDFAAAPFLTTTTHPPMMITLVETLAIGYMYENMARGSKEGYARADRYINRVFENIKGIIDGDFKMVDASDVLVPELEGSWALTATTDYTPTFGEDDPLSWSPDSDKLDDIESDRD